MLSISVGQMIAPMNSNLFGRGDKDVAQVAEKIKLQMPKRSCLIRIYL